MDSKTATPTAGPHAAAVQPNGSVLDAAAEEAALLYLRISADDEGEREGVQRQEADGRTDLERRGVPLWGVFEDNDITAGGSKRRPDFEEALDVLRTGRRNERGFVANAVWVWDLDRATRNAKDFLALYETLNGIGGRLLYPGGAADFKTREGLYEVNLRAGFAMAELEKMRQRALRRQAEDARKGHWHAGGTEPFGYDLVGAKGNRHLEMNEDEAPIVREAARRVLGGESLGSVSRDFDRRGIRTKQGRRWSGTLLKSLLTRASISGRREHAGAVTAPGDWPALISTEDSDRLRALLGDPKRDRRGSRTGPFLRSNAHLLSGLLTCHCGARMVVDKREHRRRYVCRSGPGFWGCGGCTIDADRAEGAVREQLFELEASGRLEAILAGDQAGDLAAAQAELAEASAGLQQIGYRRAHGEDPDLLAGEQAGYTERKRAAQETIARLTRKLDLPDLRPGLKTLWPRLTIPEKRALVRAALAEPVVRVRPGHRGRWDPERLEIPWRA